MTTETEARRILVGLALSEHMGDVNDYLPRLCSLLGEDPPEWDDDFDRYRMAWEDPEDPDA